MYDFGQGVAQDFTRAAAFYTKSCNAGNAELATISVCCSIGATWRYAVFRAVTLNLSRSCDMGIATSCSEVGLSYIHGVESPRILRKANSFSARLFFRR